MCVCACVRVRACARVRACVRACVCVCECVCADARARVWVWLKGGGERGIQYYVYIYYSFEDLCTYSC